MVGVALEISRNTIGARIVCPTDSQIHRLGAAAPVFNIHREPPEEHPQIGAALWSGASFQDMAYRHMMTIKKYPHNKLGKGTPYSGIDNLRPESVDTVKTFMSWQPKK